MSADTDRGTEPAGSLAGTRRIFSVSLSRTMFTEATQLAELEVEAVSEAEARGIARMLIARGEKIDWWNFEEPVEDPGAVTIHRVAELEGGGDGGGGT